MSSRTITMYSPDGQMHQVDPRNAYARQQAGWVYTPPMFPDPHENVPSREELMGRAPAQSGDLTGDARQIISSQYTQDTVTRLDTLIPSVLQRIAGYGSMDIQNYVHNDSDGNIYWKSGADQDAVTNLMKTGMSEKEANASIMRVESALGIRPAGEFIALPDAIDGSQVGFVDPYGSGGGGGGGRSAPVYTPPDRRVVEENARNQMVALIGQIDPAAVQRVTDAYMRDHRKAWEGASLDPNMTMLEELRNMEAYKKIHKLRPDSADEATWVSQHRQAWAQGGGRVSEAEDKAIDLATIGATASADNAALSEFGEGFQTDTFRNKMRRAASVAVQQVQ